MKALLLRFMLLAAALPGTIAAQNAIYASGIFRSFTEYIECDPDQKVALQTLENNLQASLENLAGYYKLLAEEKIILDDGSMRIPLREGMETTSEGRFVLSEEALVFWENEKPARIVFNQRKSRQGRTDIRMRHWIGRAVNKSGQSSLNSIADGGFALDIYIQEKTILEKRNRTVLRIFTGRDLRNINQALDLPAEAREARKEDSFQVNEPLKRIAYIREYADLLDLLIRRVDWRYRSKKSTNDQDLRRLQPDL